MLQYPDIDPVAFQIGPLAVHWYGIMYLIGFATAWGLALWRVKNRSDWTSQQVGDLIFYGALGVIIGGRLGFMLFYNLSNFIYRPWTTFAIWQGGMSFHGGLLGVIVALIIFARRMNKHFWEVADFVAPLTPIGIGAGRIGNFINGELWGRVTDAPWAMVFPQAGPLPRHPSQLYEFLLEGVVLFIILWLYSAQPRPRGAVSGVFLCGYGLFRFFTEFFRQPAAYMGYIAWGWLTMGQLLSVPMIVIGVGLISHAYCKQKVKYHG